MGDQLFVFGKPVSERAFTDRETECKRLVNNFTYGINTFLISPRRWGKTSLVKKAIGLTESRTIKTVFVDVFKCKTPYEFCEALVSATLKSTSSAVDEILREFREMLERVQIHINLSPDPASSLSFDFGLQQEDKIIEQMLSLPQEIARKKKIRLVVCIDEFQQITEFKDQLVFQKVLRTIWQHQDLVTYCLFGSKKHMMEGLFDDESKPFFKFADIIYLKTISLEYWENFISERFESKGKTITKEQIRQICESVEYHSSYVQQLCWYVFLNSDNTVTSGDIIDGIEELVAQNTALFESRTESLPATQMRLLRVVADGITEGITSSAIISKYKLGSSASVVASKTALLEKNLIYSENNQLKLSDPVMGIWLKR